VNSATDAEPPGPRAGYGTLARVFLRISVLGFGGPTAHIALMLDEVVERRRWLTRRRFLDIVGVTNLLPGPNSSEVAIHVGWTQQGWRGALLAGLCFAGPTFVIVVALSALYFRYGTLPEVSGLFSGVQPVVLALVLAAGWKLARVAVTRPALVLPAAFGLLTTVFFEGWELAALAVGAVIGLSLRRGGHSPAGGTVRGVALVLGAVPLAGELSRLFALMAVSGSVLFGGGYMLIPLLEPRVTEPSGWLTTQQFLDGIALTQAAPGPIVSLSAFAGYGLAGVAGAVVAMVGIYLPSFTAVMLAAPRLERWRRRERVSAALEGINAAVAGSILGVMPALAPDAVPDVLSAVLFAAALVLLIVTRVGAVWLVLGGIVAGAARVALGA
jgi:chromate transporter